jgi:hypothetical protein
VSREIGECFSGGFVPEASQSGTIVVGDEGEDEGVSLGVIVEAVPSGVGGCRRVVSESLGKPSVEAFGHAVGLRPVGAGELVAHAVVLADPVEGVSSGSLLAPAPTRIAEAVGELRTIIRQNSVDRVAEGLEEALQASGDGCAAALLDDFHMHEAGGPARWPRRHRPPAPAGAAGA